MKAPCSQLLMVVLFLVCQLGNEGGSMTQLGYFDKLMVEKKPTNAN